MMEMRTLRNGTTKPYRTDFVSREKARHARNNRKADNLCQTAASHGPATHGVRCEACAETHRRSA